MLRRLPWLMAPLAIVALTTLQPAAASGEPEVRAFWADTFASGLKTRAQIDTLVAHVVEANANTIVAQVRRRGDSFYAISIEPFTDDTGVEPGLDPASARRGCQPDGIRQQDFLIARLDQESSSKGNIHVVYLKNAEATRVAQTLRAVVSQDASALQVQQGTQGSSIQSGTGSQQGGPGGRVGVPRRATAYADCPIPNRRARMAPASTGTQAGTQRRTPWARRRGLARRPTGTRRRTRRRASRPRNGPR